MTVRMSKRTLTVLAFAAAIGAALPAMAASDYLLTLEGIKGESKVIALDKVDWRAMPTAGCSGKLAAGSMIITGDLPATQAGKHIEKAVLTMRKSGGSAMTIKLEDAMISSITPPTTQKSSAAPSLGKLGRVEYGGGSWSVQGCRDQTPRP